MYCRLFTFFIALIHHIPADAIPLTILKSNEEKNLHFYYHDSLGYGHPVSVKGDTKMLINSPVLLFEADKNQTPYLIYPGESINIKKDRLKYSEFTINDNVERNNELLFFQALVKQFGGIYMTLPIPKYQGKADNLKQVHNFEMEINNIKNYRLFFLDLFFSKHRVSDNFRKIAKSIILSTAIKDSILLYRNNISLLKNAKLYNRMFEQIIARINELEYSPFMPYLYVCLLPVSINISDKNSTEYIINNKTQFSRAFNFIETNFKKPAKIFLLARTVYAALDNNLSIPDYYLQRFKTQCTDTTYIKLINNKLLEKAIINTETTLKKNAVLLMDDSLSDLDNLIEKNKGKLIYLDFWASWCSPCRSEMSYSVKLRKLFEKKKIVFIYISIDKNVSDWKKASQEESINNNNNYLMLNSDQSSFINQHKIKSIPRYILIGRKGKIISENAPRPSNKEIIKMINTHLK